MNNNDVNINSAKDIIKSVYNVRTQLNEGCAALRNVQFRPQCFVGNENSESHQLYTVGKLMKNASE